MKLKIFHQMLKPTAVFSWIKGVGVASSPVTAIRGEGETKCGNAAKTQIQINPTTGVCA